MWNFPREQAILRKSKTPRKSPEKWIFPALLQKLVGDFFFDFSQGNLENLVGNLEGIFRGFFSDPQNKGSNISGKISEHFSYENSWLEKNLSCKIHSADVPP